MADSVQAFFSNLLQINEESQSKLLLALAIVLLLWLVRTILVRIIHRRFSSEPTVFYRWRKILDYTLVVIGLFLVGRIWIEGVQSLATYLGLLSAGLAIALQDLIISLAGWAFIIWRRPFVVGDRVQVGESMGDVIDVRLFSFDMLEIGSRIDAEQSTGRIIHIPNGVVFNTPLANYNQGLPFIWNEIPVMVTFESDWEKAKRFLADIVNKHAPDIHQGVDEYNKSVNKRFVIAYKNLTPTVYTAVADSGVLLTARYMLPPRQIRGSEHAIWEDVLRTFNQHWDIDFAYPTQREYIHYQEKKAPEIHESPTVVLKRPLTRPRDDQHSKGED